MGSESNNPEMTKQLNIARLFWKYFLLMFLPVLILTTVACAFIYYLELNSMIEVFRSRRLRAIDSDRIAISNEIANVAYDLEIICRSHHLSEAALDQETGKELLAQEFIAMCQTKKHYYQIRYIDRTGREKVRVDRLGNKVVRLPEKKLQNKSGRYYFKETIELKKNQVYVSPLDLNIEHGKVEVPHKPVIRIGKPVYYKDGSKAGIIIINYLADYMLDSIANESSMLLNEASYWLKGGIPEQNFAFMFPKRKDINFANLYPDAWEKIAPNPEGQFFYGDGLITYVTVCPEWVVQAAISGNYLKKIKAPPDRSDIAKQDCLWKMVSFIKNSKAAMGATKLRNILLAAYGVLAFGFGLAALAMARLLLRNRIVEACRQESEERLKLAMQSSDTVLWRWNINTGICGSMITGRESSDIPSNRPRKSWPTGGSLCTRTISPG